MTRRRFFLGLSAASAAAWPQTASAGWWDDAWQSFNGWLNATLPDPCNPCRVGPRNSVSYPHYGDDNRRDLSSGRYEDPAREGHGNDS